MTGAKAVLSAPSSPTPLARLWLTVEEEAAKAGGPVAVAAVRGAAAVGEPGIPAASTVAGAVCPVRFHPRATGDGLAVEGLLDGGAVGGQGPFLGDILPPQGLEVLGVVGVVLGVFKVAQGG